MTTIGLFQPPADLKKALTAYFNFLEKPFTLVAIADLSNLLEASTLDMVILLREGTDTAIFNLIQTLRVSHNSLVTPIILFTNELNAYEQDLLADCNHTEQILLPFNSGIALPSILSVVTKSAASVEMSQKRKNIANLITKQNYREAIRQLEEYQSFESDGFRCYLLLSEVYCELVNFTAAIKAATQALKYNNRSFLARTRLATAYQQCGQLDKAESVLEQSLKLAEHHLQYLLQLGDVQMDQGRFGDSKGTYQKALDVDPSSTQAKFGMIACDLIAGKQPTQEWRVTLSSHAVEVAKFLNLRGIQLVRLKKFKTAERLYGSTIRLIEGKTEAEYKIWMNLGLCCKKAQNFPKAEEYFLKCASIAPQDYPRATQQLEWLRRHK